MGGRSDNQNDVGTACRFGCSFPHIRRQHLAEPDDLGTETAAAIVFDQLRRQAAFERMRRSTVRTTRSTQMTVKFEHVFRACRRVERIYVLRSYRQSGDQCSEIHQGTMTCIGLGTAVSRNAFVVPVPDQARIAGETFGRCQVLDPVLAPVAVRAAERR